MDMTSAARTAEVTDKTTVASKVARKVSTMADTTVGKKAA